MHAWNTRGGNTSAVLLRETALTVIPRIFHFIFLNLGTEAIREQHAQFVMGWMAKHPGWMVYFWTKSNLPPLVNQELYDRSTCSGIRSDLVRYQVLYNYGGIYADVDFECLASIEKFLDRDILLARESPDSIGQAIMGCCAKHPFLKRLIDDQAEFASTHPGNAIEQTGPKYVTSTYNAWTPKFDIVENYKVFFPLVWNDPNPKAAPESVAVHHMAGLWRKSPMHVSYILPFFHKADLFRMMLPVNDCFRAEGVEVVLVLDEPSDEKAVMELVTANSGDINFRVVVNDEAHDWRPPCIAYNVGIRHALADHVILTDPESAIVMPRADYPKVLIERDYRLCYGGICWKEEDFKVGDQPALIQQKVQVCEAMRPVWLCGHGFLLAPKLALERICGFDESRTTYGLDDDDIRVRLVRLGYPMVLDGRIKVFHTMHPDTERTESRDLPGPNIALTQQRESWGRRFNRVAYDWQKI